MFYFINIYKRLLFVVMSVAKTTKVNNFVTEITPTVNNLKESYITDEICSGF